MTTTIEQDEPEVKPIFDAGRFNDAEYERWNRQVRERLNEEKR